MALGFAKILCCFNSLRAITIEYMISILSSIGLILGVLGTIFIPWKVSERATEILFIITFIFILLSFIVSLLIIYLRKKYQLSKRVTKPLVITIIIIVFLCFFSLILIIVVALVIFSNLKNKETSKVIDIIEETGETEKITYIEKSMANTFEKIITIIIIAILIIIWLLLIFLWISDYLRLICNYEGPYNDYSSEEKKRQLRHPIKYGLNVLGHDKYGFPIFGKQKGNKFKIKGVKNKFEEKIIPQSKYSDKYFDESGKINIKYYANGYQKQIPKEKMNEIIQEKEKYMEKYDIQNYTNFDNKTILNFDDNNNSINPGYEI